MTFPTIPTVAGGRVLTTTGLTCASGQTFPNLSSLTKNAGDLLIAIVIIYDGNSTNAEFSGWGAGFTEFADSASTTTMGIGAAYKWSDGTETGTFTVTSADTSTNDYCTILLSIPGAHASTPPEWGSRADGTSAAADPASFNPAGWDTEDTLWIAVGASGETSTTGSYTGIASAPTNYTNYVDTGISADAVGGVEGAVAFRQLNAASENVGGFSVDLSNAKNAAIVIAVRPAPSVQDLTPGLFTNGQTFHASTVTPGAVGLTPSLFSNDQTFYAATVSSTYALTPALFTDDDTFHAATVSAANALTPDLYTDGDTFYSATVTQTGPQDLSPALFTDGDTFHAATVSATYSLTPALYTNGQTFYAPTAAASNTLTPALFTDDDTFHSATVSASYALSPALYTDGDTFYSATVTPGAVTLTPALFTDGDTFHAATVTQDGGPQTLTPSLFSNAQAFYAATVSTAYNLAPALLTDGDTFYDATVAPGAVTLTPGLLSNAQVFYAATVTGGEVPIDYTRAPGGAGYQRPAITITRPGSANQRRPAMTNQRRP
jgi:hypothetical protein